MKTRREFLRYATRASGMGLLGLLPGDGFGTVRGEGWGVLASAQPQAPSFRGVSAGDEWEVHGIQLRWCPPGAFVMGSPPGESGRRSDEGQVAVRLTKGFWIGRFEVTQGQWRQFVRQFPDRRPTAEFGEGEALPVYWVSYLEAADFCSRVTVHARHSGDVPSGWEFRLPTEAQWEYACRAGTVTATSFGDRLGRDQANFGGEPLNGGRGGPALRRASRVGSYPANRWGICDMHGNVFEWCRDWYHARLPGGTDPDLHDRQGLPNGDGTYSRVRRGGAWNDDAWACRSALRLRYEPHRRSDHIGFRVVLVESG